MNKQLYDAIIYLFNKHGSSLKLSDIVREFDIKAHSSDYNYLIEQLNVFVKQGLLAKTHDNVYFLTNASNKEDKSEFLENESVPEDSERLFFEVDIELIEAILGFYEINPTSYLTAASNEYLHIETDTPAHKSFIKHLELLEDERILKINYQNRYYLSNKSNVDARIAKLKDKYAKTDEGVLVKNEDARFEIKAGLVDAVMNVFKDATVELGFNSIVKTLCVEPNSDNHKSLLFHVRLLREHGVLHKKANGKYTLIQQLNIDAKLRKIKALGKKHSANASVSIGNVSSSAGNALFEDGVVTDWFARSILNVFKDQKTPLPIEEIATHLDIKPFSRDAADLAEKLTAMVESDLLYKTSKETYGVSKLNVPVYKIRNEHIVDSILRFIKDGDKREFDIDDVIIALNMEGAKRRKHYARYFVYRLNEYGLLKCKHGKLYSLVAPLNNEDMPELTAIIDEIKSGSLIKIREPFPLDAKAHLLNDIFNLLANSTRQMRANTICDSLGIVISSADYWILLQHLNLLMSRGVIKKTIIGHYYLSEQSKCASTYLEAADIVIKEDLVDEKNVDKPKMDVNDSKEPAIKEKLEEVVAVASEDMAVKDEGSAVKSEWGIVNHVWASAKAEACSLDILQRRILDVIVRKKDKIHFKEIASALKIDSSSSASAVLGQKIKELVEKNILNKDINKFYTLCKPDVEPEMNMSAEEMRAHILKVFTSNTGMFKLADIRYELNIKEHYPVYQTFIEQVKTLLAEGVLFHDKHKNYGIKWKERQLLQKTDAAEALKNDATIETPAGAVKTDTPEEYLNFFDNITPDIEPITSDIIPKTSSINIMNNDILDKIINLFREKSDTMQLLDISKALGIKSDSEEYADLVEKLELLVEQHVLEKKTRRRYSLVIAAADYGLVGIFRIEGKRQFIETDTEEMPIINIKRNMGLGAKHGDKVKCCVINDKRGKNGKIQGEVVEILEHCQTEIAGCISYEDGNYYLIPDDAAMEDFRIPSDMLHGARNGDKVLCEVVAWNDNKDSCPLAKVKSITGKQGEPSDMYRSIINEFNLPLQFPTNAEKEAMSVVEPANRKVKGRLDLRKERVITIDPFTAKDFDDALSLVKLPDGNWRLGVHIADVSHYVKEGSAIDIEAQKRGNSVYLVDRVIPMLPESLSNEVCSLNPDAVRYTYSVLIDMDAEYNTIGYEITPSMIKSCRRFTYEEVQDIIDTESGDECDLILALYKLTKHLKKQRVAAGSINFYNREVKYILDDTLAPVDVELHEPTESTSLVEECMLLANQLVARYLKVLSKQYNSKTGNNNLLPFIYRVHEKPMQERLQAAIANMQASGIRYKTKEVTPAVINSILEQVDNTPFKELINNIFIMAMTRAVYSTTNTGHFGLNFTDYTQFTSPIRRYSDLLVHRLLKEYDTGDYKPARINRLHKELPAIASHISTTEKEAASAERASTKLAATIFAQSKLGEVFDGTISGITDKGIFVTLDDIYCEGFVRCRNLLPKDDYKFEFKAMKLQGRKTKQVYIFGMRVRVLIKNVNIVKREITLEMIEEEEI